MVKKLTDKLSEISYRRAMVAHFSFGVCMKKTVFWGVALLLMVIASACSSISGGPAHDMVYDIQSIEPKSENTRMVDLPVKDFNVVGPVFAQTSIDLSEFQSSEFNSSVYEKGGNSKRYKKARGEHKVVMEGSYLIQRLLIEEAYKKGADAIVNINIEYENSCHLVGVSDNTDVSTSYSKKVLDVDVSGAVSVSGAYNHASQSVTANGHRVADVSATQIASSVLGNQNVEYKTRTETGGSSYVYKFNEEQNNCHLVIYGSALSIKYTNAIVPQTCN